MVIKTADYKSDAGFNPRQLSMGENQLLFTKIKIYILELSISNGNYTSWLKKWGRILHPTTHFKG